MSETIAIAIIAALSGIGGALLGGIASVIGPWWLKKLDDKKDELEMRRKILVRFCEIQIQSVSEFHQVFTLANPKTNCIQL